MLKVVAPVLLIALAACAAGSASTQGASGEKQLSEKQQRALAGRALGKPISCVQNREILDTDAITDSVVLFRMRGGKTYRNDLPQSCPRLSSPGTAFSHRSTMDQLCSGEIIQVFDPVSRFCYGSCTLGKFTPYEVPQDTPRDTQ